MTDADELAAAGTGRAQGWVVTYWVEVIFDTDVAGRGYDHVATTARCRHCQQEFNLRRSDDALDRHARTHQGELSINPGAPSTPYPQPRR
ncbi:MAG: hypothetical protein M3083_06020 [Actinomycetota bacterium]|nr:hypothetical protein [Actinomycetota bacterium]